MTAESIRRAAAPFLQYGALGLLAIVIIGGGTLAYLLVPKVLDKWQQSIEVQTKMISQLDGVKESLNGIRAEISETTDAVEDLRREYRTDNR